MPRIKDYYPSFGWRENEFLVRDSKWVDLMRHSSNRPYFYDECLHPSNRKNAKGPVFKTKQFGLFVIVPEAQWEEFLTFRANKLKSPSLPPTCAQRASQQPLHSTIAPPHQNTHTSEPIRARTFSHPDTVPLVSTPSVASQPTSSSEPPTPLFLSRRRAASTASSRALERPISEDILGNNVVYH